MIIYKIRKKNTSSEFLNGTPTSFRYGNTGRIFQKISQLRTFLTIVMRRAGLRSNISEWEIVEYTLEENTVKGIHEVVKPEKIVELLRL